VHPRLPRPAAPPIPMPTLTLAAAEAEGNGLTIETAQLTTQLKQARDEAQEATAGLINR
jgi:hypothetical protein